MCAILKLLIQELTSKFSIEDWFTVLRTEKKAAGRRSAAKVLLQEAEAFEDDVVVST